MALLCCSTGSKKKKQTPKFYKIKFDAIYAEAIINSKK